MADRGGRRSIAIVPLPTLHPAGLLASIVNLNGPAHYVHWHFFTMSVANVVVIVLVAIVFVLAVALPYPGPRSGGGQP